MPTKIPHTKSFESQGAKVTCLKGNDRLLFGMCISLSLSKSEQSRFLCVRVYTTWKYKFFQGPLPPKRPYFFLQRKNIKENAQKQRGEKKNLREVRKAALINTDTGKWNIVNKQSMYTV